MLDAVCQGILANTYYVVLIALVRTPRQGVDSGDDLRRKAVSGQILQRQVGVLDRVVEQSNGLTGFVCALSTT